VGEIKKKRILNDQVFYFLSTAIVILIVIVIELIKNLSSIHGFVLHTNGLQVDADYIPELGFSSRDFGSKYHNLYSTTPCLMRPFFITPFNGRYRLYIYSFFFKPTHTSLSPIWCGFVPVL
jgi:hypothetical protein